MPSRALAAIVIVHFIVSVIHGLAHNVARVALTPAESSFVIIVILIGPVVGLGLTWIRPLGGSLVVTVCMAAALAFGVIKHFLLPGADHVSQVDAEWKMLFGSSAALLALLEAGGTFVGAVVARQHWRRVS